MKLIDVLSLLGKTFLIMVAVLLLLELSSHLKAARNSSFIYESIDSDDWAETAHALGIHPDSLTMEMFEQHDTTSFESKATIESVTEFMSNPKKW